MESIISDSKCRKRRTIRLGNSRKIHRLDSYDYYVIGYFYYRITIIIVFDYTDIQKNTLQCWFSMLWLSVPVLGFLSLLRLRVLFVLFLKLSEPVSHALFFGRSVLFLSRFLSVLNCLLPFCKVLVTIRSTPTNERFSVYFSEHLILQIPIDKIINIIFYHNHICNSILFR